MVDPAQIRERWRQAAPGWMTHGAVVREMTEPVSRAMLERAAPVPGERWLDVAGGVGDPGLYLAAALGAAGRLVLTDLVVEMAAGGRSVVRGTARAVRVDAVAAAAEGMPFAHAFDGLTCRFGAMFFADPPRALDELRRTLVPAGRAVFAVWGELERNVMFHEVDAAVRARFPETPAPDPREPHPFRFAAPGELAEVLREAGWTRVGEGRLPFTMASGVTLDRFWDHLTGVSTELRKRVSGLPEKEVLALRKAVEDRVAPSFESGRMRFPAEARLVWARAPRRIPGRTETPS